MTPDALRQWLAIVQLPGLGCSHLKILDALLAASERGHTLAEADFIAAGFAPALWYSLQKILDGECEDEARRSIDAALHWSESPRHHVLALASPTYPPLLRELSDPPPVLFVKGDPAALALPQIGIVGTRKPSAEGRRNARRFAADLVTAGYAITSGLALGIDAESHAGALDTDGITIAVLGAGLDRIYPASNAALAARIVETGALVSEFPPDAEAAPWHFPQRNRIISGLGRGIVVVEAAQRSGSLITARLAGEQGREVFALPGSINNPMARGCHQLIRQGVKLVESVADVLEELPALREAPLRMPPMENEVTTVDLDQAARQVLACIAYDPVPADSLARSTGFDIATLYPFLVALELQGLIETTPGGYVLSTP